MKKNAFTLFREVKEMARDREREVKIKKKNLENSRETRITLVTDSLSQAPNSGILPFNYRPGVPKEVTNRIHL